MKPIICDVTVRLWIFLAASVIVAFDFLLKLITPSSLSPTCRFFHDGNVLFLVAGCLNLPHSVPSESHFLVCRSAKMIWHAIVYGATELHRHVNPSIARELCTMNYFSFKFYFIYGKKNMIKIQRINFWIAKKDPFFPKLTLQDTPYFGCKMYTYLFLSLWQLSLFSCHDVWME